MEARTRASGRGRRGLVGDLIGLERTLGVEAARWIYWVGLGVIALVAFAVVGAAVGVMLRSGFPEGLLIGFPLLVAGVLAVAVMTLLWRGACEFFLAVFDIADDLRALREAQAPPARAQVPPVGPPSRY